MDSAAVAGELAPLLDAFSGRASLAFHAFPAGPDLLVEADAEMPAASLVKLPILACALAEAEAGRLDPTRRLRVEEGDHAGGDGVLRLLDGGLEPTIHDLLTLMICVSDNTATNLIIDELGPARIGDWLRAAGMARTALVGRLQRPEAERTPAQRRGERNRTSAADVLGLLVGLERGDLLPPRARERMVAILAKGQHTEGIGRYLPIDRADPEAPPAPLVLHAKSGVLPGVRHDAALVRYASGAPAFALAVLTDGSRDRDEHVEQEGLLLIARSARLLWRALSRS